MVKRIESTHLIVSPDPMMNEVAEEAIRMLADDGMSVKKHQMPVFEDLFPAIPDANSTSLFAKNVELPKSYDLKAFSAIMHSSGMRRKLSCLRHATKTHLGSTGHPKPIRWTGERIVWWGSEPSMSLKH